MGIRYLLLLLTIAFSQYAGAEIYKWIDDNGKVHFSDSKPVEQSTETVKLKINSYTNVTFELAPVTPSKSGQRKRVIMYSTSWCGYCKKARRYFNAKGIAFKEYDIEKSQSAKKAYDKLGGRGVPVILVGKSRMNGFSERGFKKLYEG